MKYFALLIAALFSYMTLSSELPRCNDGRWSKSDIVLFTGGDNCTNRIATCIFQGTRSEGWYSYEKTKGKVIAKQKCGDQSEKPECIESANEEFIILHDRTIFQGSCSNLDIVCINQGTSKEAWAIYPSNERKLIAYENCF